MKPAQRNGVFVADFASDGARLGEAKVVRFRGSAATDNTRLFRHESAVLLVPQTNGLARDPSPTGDDGRRHLRSIKGRAELWRRLVAVIAGRRL